MNEVQKREAIGQWRVERIDEPPFGIRATWLQPSMPASEREPAAALDDLLSYVKAERRGVVFEGIDSDRRIAHAERVLEKAMKRASTARIQPAKMMRE